MVSDDGYSVYLLVNLFIKNRVGMSTLYGCLWLTVLPKPTSVSNYRKFSEKRVEKMLSDIDDYGAHPIGINIFC